jgi:signal transduction histidine kinase
MSTPRPDTLFRFGALIGIAIVAALPIVNVFNSDVAQMLRAAGVDDLSRLNLTAVRVALAGVHLAVAALFAGAFWVNTRTDTIDRPRKLAVVLLVVQALLAFGTTDYFFIVAAQAPFVFAPVGALAWLAGQLLVFAIFAVSLASSGAIVTIPEMANAPSAVAVPMSIVYVIGWQVFAFSVGYLAASERRSRRELQRSTRDLIATQQMLADSSRVAERVQISRELHDTLGHNLAVLNVNLELASHLTDGRAADAVAKAQTVARLLLADVRDVVHSLGENRDVDLRGALTTLVAGTHEPAIHLSLPEDLDVADPAKAHAIFRCVQEAITNAVRHARARNLWIELARTSDGLDVHIHDDGRGESDVRLGHGLKGMRERVEAAGGWLKLQSEPGRGFAIDASIPLSREMV